MSEDYPANKRVPTLCLQGGRRGVRPAAGPDERLVTWKKSRQKFPYPTPAEWAALPEEITVRVIRVRVKQAGFRTRTLVLVTTLLDPVEYPAAEVAAAYLRRWRIELCLDDLNTVLGLGALRCKSPAMIHRELLALLVAHNLVRAVMANAAREHAVALDRLSFTGLPRRAAQLRRRERASDHARPAPPRLGRPARAPRRRSRPATPWPQRTACGQTPPQVLSPPQRPRHDYRVLCPGPPPLPPSQNYLSAVRSESLPYLVNQKSNVVLRTHLRGRRNSQTTGTRALGVPL